MELVRGTTPILIYTFSEVNVSDISVAYLTIKQNNVAIITKDLTEATVGENTISWQLTQEETLTLNCWTANVFCDWRLVSGVRGAGNSFSMEVVSSGKNEVI